MEIGTSARLVNYRRAIAKAIVVTTNLSTLQKGRS